MRLLSTVRLAVAIPRVDLAPLRNIALGIVLFVSAVSLPNLVGSDNPDEGWQLAFTQLNGARAGVDYIHSHGPLYYLVISPYEPTLFWQKFVMELHGKGAMTLLILRLARRLPAATGTLWTLGLSLLLLLPLPLQVELALLASTAALLVPLLGERIAISDIAVAAVYLAAVSLSKFTACAFAIAGLSVLSAVLVAEKPRWKALLPFGIYAVSLAAFFTLVGQRLSDLPAYIASGFAFCGAYTEGHAIEGPTLEVRLALIILTLLSVAVLSAGRGLLLQRKTLAKTALLAILSALYWKAGFVRHDGHALFFFAVMLLLPTLVPLAVVNAPRLELRRGAILLATLLAGLGMLEVLIREKILAPALSTSPLALWPSRLRQLSHPGEVQANLEQRRLAAKAQFDLPRIRAAVGDATIDAFTDCQGVLILNGLHYVPRLTLQSVNAVDPDWLRRNGTKLQSESAPRFLLLKWISFDGRYPTLTDGPALLAMLQHYDVKLEENGYLLLERRTVPRPAKPELVMERTAEMDEVIELPSIEPGEYRSLTLDLQMTVQGKLRTAAYQSPTFFFLVRDEGGAWHTFRTVAPMARAEFLLDPLCENNADLKALFETGQGRRVTAISMRVQHGERSLVEPAYTLQLRRYH